MYSTVMPAPFAPVATEESPCLTFVTAHEPVEPDVRAAGESTSRTDQRPDATRVSEDLQQLDLLQAQTKKKIDHLRRHCLSRGEAAELAGKLVAQASLAANYLPADDALREETACVREALSPANGVVSLAHSGRAGSAPIPSVADCYDLWEAVVAAARAQMLAIMDAEGSTA